MLRPASGSVTAKQALSRPAISGGSQRRFCSSVPNTTTGCSPKMFMWIAEAPESPAPVRGDRLHHQRRLGDAEARAAVRLRHGDAEPAGVGERAVEVVGEAALAVLAQPVVGVERRAEPLDRVADAFLLGREGEIHVSLRPDDLVRRLAVGRGVDHEHLHRRLARHREDVHHVGREVARVAGTELAALAADLGERGALEHVADLLDPRVGVRQRALAALDDAEHDLDALRADGFRDRSGGGSWCRCGSRDDSAAPRRRARSNGWPSSVSRDSAGARRAAREERRSISRSEQPASRSTSTVCSPSRGAGAGAPSGVPDQDVGAASACRVPSVG